MKTPTFGAICDFIESPAIAAGYPVVCKWHSLQALIGCMFPDEGTPDGAALADCTDPSAQFVVGFSNKKPGQLVHKQSK